MGGIYSKNDQTASNVNNPGFPHSFPTNITTTSQSRNDYSNLTSGFNRGINSTIPSYGLLQLPNSRDRNTDDVNYRYLSENTPYQQRNLSVSPSQLLSNSFKSQTYGSNQAQLVLNSNSHQNRSIVLQHMTSRNEPPANQYIQSTGGKLGLNSSSSLYSLSQQPHLNHQPPYKRPRLTQDFNLSQQSQQQQHHHQLSSNVVNQVAAQVVNQQQAPVSSLNNATAASILASLSQATMFQRGSPHHISNPSTANNNSVTPNQQKLSLSNYHHSQGPPVLQQQQHAYSGSNKEPSYYPQVEAISPVPEDLRHGESTFLSEKENIEEQLRTVIGEIQKTEQQLKQLGETKAEMKEKLNSASLEIKEDENITTAPHDPIQSLLADNHKRALEQHRVFEKLCGDKVSWDPLSLPIYRQPSDLKCLDQIRRNFKTKFKPLLISYIRKRKLAEKERLKILGDNYETTAKAWYKRLEKTQNSFKRRQKEAKYRETFEKIFPEIRRNREERERDDFNESSQYNFDSYSNLSRHGTITNNSVGINIGNNSTNISGDNNSDSITTLCANTRSVTNLLQEQQRDRQRERGSSPFYPTSQRELDRMREYAIDPPVILAPWQRKHEVVHASRLIRNPKSQQSNFQEINLTWASQENNIFIEQFIANPKNFARIAENLPKKSVADCVQYYYLTKKNNKYKTLVKKNARRRRERRIPRNEDIVIQNDTITNSEESNKFESVLPNLYMEVNQLVNSNNNNKESKPTSSNVQSKSTSDTMGISSSTNSNSTMYNNNNNNNKTENVTTARCSNEVDKQIKNNPRKDDGDKSDSDDHKNDKMSCNSTSINISSSNSQINKSNNSQSSNNGNNQKSENEKSNQENTSNKRKSKELMSDLNKHDMLHVKDAINFSIEQNLINAKKSSESSGSSSTSNYRRDQSLKSPNKYDRNNTNYSNSTKSSDNKNQKNLEDSVLNKSNQCATNRAILMKDFCTAQMLNQINSNNSNDETNTPEKPSSSSSTPQLPVLNQDPFVARVSKLYEEEVECFINESRGNASRNNNNSVINNNNNNNNNASLTVPPPISAPVPPSVPNTDFRDRSDSQRTRSSSEAANYYKMMKIKKQKALNIEQQSSNNNNKEESSNFGMPPPQSNSLTNPSTSEESRYPSPKKETSLWSDKSMKNSTNKTSFYDNNNNNINSYHIQQQQHHHHHQQHHQQQQQQNYSQTHYQHHQHRHQQGYYHKNPNKHYQEQSHHKQHKPSTSNPTTTTAFSHHPSESIPNPSTSSNISAFQMAAVAAAAAKHAQTNHPPGESSYFMKQKSSSHSSSSDFHLSSSLSINASNSAFAHPRSNNPSNLTPSNSPDLSSGKLLIDLDN